MRHGLGTAHWRIGAFALHTSTVHARECRELYNQKTRSGSVGVAMLLAGIAAPKRYTLKRSCQQQRLRSLQRHAPLHGALVGATMTQGFTLNAFV